VIRVASRSGFWRCLGCFAVVSPLSVLDGQLFLVFFNLVSRAPTGRYSSWGVTRRTALLEISAGNCPGSPAWRAWMGGAFPQPAFRVRRSCTGPPPNRNPWTPKPTTELALIT
jgi:hypothetical protein